MTAETEPLRTLPSPVRLLVRQRTTGWSVVGQATSRTSAYMPDAYMAVAAENLQPLLAQGLITGAWAADGVEYMVGAADPGAAGPAVAAVFAALIDAYPAHPVDFHVVPAGALPPGPPYQDLYATEYPGFTDATLP